MSDEHERAYGEGYKAGKEGDCLRDTAQSLSEGWHLPGTDWKRDESYDAGYKAGAKDRYKPDSDSSSSSGSSDSWCFVTTACVRIMGQTDDCHELTVLRAFRDRYLLAREDGQAAVRHYYEIAPRLIAAIERSLHPEEAFKEIYDALVAPTVRMIEDGHTERAFDYYQTKIIQLAGRYLGSSA